MDLELTDEQTLAQRVRQTLLGREWPAPDARAAT